MIRAWLETLTVRLLGAAGIGLGCLGLYVDLVSWDSRGLAESLGAGRVLTAETAIRLIDRGEDRPALRTCRRDALLATGRLAAASVDSVIAAGDVSRVKPAIDNLDHIARRILDCSPGESVAWTWLALARNQTPGNDDEVKRLFERSQWTAPSDLEVIAIRLPEIARALSRRGDLFAPTARADIRALLSADHNAWDTAQIIGPVFTWIGAITQAEFASVTDPVRREALIQAFGHQRANIAGCERLRFNDWLYRGQQGSCETEDRIPSFDWQKTK